MRYLEVTEYPVFKFLLKVESCSRYVKARASKRSVQKLLLITVTENFDYSTLESDCKFGLESLWWNERLVGTLGIEVYKMNVTKRGECAFILILRNKFTRSVYSFIQKAFARTKTEEHKLEQIAQRLRTINYTRSLRNASFEQLLLETHETKFSDIELDSELRYVLTLIPSQTDNTWRAIDTSASISSNENVLSRSIAEPNQLFSLAGLSNSE